MAESVLTIVAERAVDSIAAQLGYIRNYKANFENLEKQVNILQGRRDAVQHKVEEATRNGDEIEEHVQKWLDSVNNKIIEATDIMEDNKRLNMGCFKSLCPDLKKRYQQSKKAAMKTDYISELHNEGTFDGVSYRKEIRHSTMEGILHALRDPDVNMIGVCGMGGSGKTTLVREVARKAEEDHLFNQVVFAEVSDTVDIRKIQEVIAERLGLKFHEDTEPVRADRLRNRIVQEGKILLILDNIWKDLDLAAVGIPFGNNHVGCKLLWTSRDMDLLNRMGSERNFFLDVLEEEEACNLFMKIAGVGMEQHDLRSLAFQVAKACGGLLVAITIVAKALKNKQQSEWNVALRELRKPPSLEHVEGSVVKNAFMSIYLSYKHLESEELKSTFLLCSTMARTKDASIEELLRYAVGLRLFKAENSQNTMEDVRYKAKKLVQKLKDSSLLLGTRNSETFSIHDVVRDVGRWIAHKDEHKFTVIDTVIPRQWADENTMQNCTSLTLHDILELPKPLKCPQLQFFYMKTKTRFTQIPDNFFKGMPNLIVLHLIEMYLSPLPASLPLLKKLRTLNLDWCHLEDIAEMKDMENLEILVIGFRSDKQLLPKEIGRLTSLRLLDLRNCSFIIPPKTISRLTQLVELYMDDWYDQREVGESVASLEELKDLSLLTALDIHVADAEILPKGLDFFQKLKRYEIVIGKPLYKYKRETLRTLSVTSDTNICSEDGVIKQLKGIEDLHLDGKQRVNNVLDELDGEGFPQLKHFRIRNNPYIQYIVDSIPSETREAFPLLETFSLENLVRLEKICHDQLRAKCFCQLTTIQVYKCGKLKNLFSSSIAKHLSCLQKIEVVDCGNMEEIFTIGRTDDVNNNEEVTDDVNNNEEIKVVDCGNMEEIFSMGRTDDVNNNEVIDVVCDQLHALTLENLPRLRRICSESGIASTSQERLMPLTTDASEDQLDALPLFGENVVFPNLKALKLSALCVEKIWHNDGFRVTFPNLTRLIIQGFGNLRYLFSSSIEFVQLKQLEICECNSLEVIIIGVEEEFRNGKKKFPRLNYMKITDLENLRRFHSVNLFEFPSLKDLEIKNCPGLKEFIFDDKVGLPNLERMTISCMDNLESIWHNELDWDSFRKLKSLEVNDCQKLMTIFSSSIWERFLRLESLTVKSCGLVEAIFPWLNFDHLEASQLRELYIDHLPNLNHIWKEDPQGMLSLENLQKVTVFLCPNLKNIFPASVARSLLKLECLEVSDCNVEEIVARGREGEEAADRFLFPQLRSMQLHCLPELKIFYPGHSVEWPYLKRLGLHHCDKVKVFISELDNPTQQLFLKSEDLLNVEDLQLSGKATAMKWQDQVPEHLFGLLQILELNDDNSTDFSLDIIQRFPKLEKLSLNCSSYKEIFSHGDVEKRLPQIKHLVLSELYDLKRIWKQDSKVHQNFQNLEILEVHSCFNLINLMPSSASFQNLTILEVWGCEGLKNLFTTFTAKSLEQLEKLEVFDCKMMTEVIVNKEAVTDEITFKKLKRLSLLYLQSLASFCSVKYILKFPILESLVVNECPKMKIFSGVTSAPRLLKLEINWKVIEQSQEIDHIIQREYTIQQDMEKRLPGREDCDDSTSLISDRPNY